MRYRRGCMRLRAAVHHFVGWRSRVCSVMSSVCVYTHVTNKTVNDILENEKYIFIFVDIPLCVFTISKVFTNGQEHYSARFVHFLTREQARRIADATEQYWCACYPYYLSFNNTVLHL
jgi:hypothetical protein